MTVRWLHGAAVTAYLSLLLLLLASVVWLAPPPAGLRSVALLLLVAPMLLPLRGLLHARRYTIAWSSLLILLYFVHGVASAAERGLPRVLGLVEIALSLGYFTMAVAYVRLTRGKR